MRETVQTKPRVVMLFLYSVAPTIVFYRWPMQLMRWAPVFGVSPSERFRRLTRCPAKAAMPRYKAAPVSLPNPAAGGLHG